MSSCHLKGRLEGHLKTLDWLLVGEMLGMEVKGKVCNNYSKGGFQTPQVTLLLLRSWCCHSTLSPHLPQEVIF